MAPSKCNYLVFSNGPLSESIRIKVTLFDEELKINEEPLFLGIRFDSKLTFINQINYLKETSINRLNLLKIIYNRRFGLNQITLNQVYISIVRSVIEYFSLFVPVISKSNLNK